MACYSEEGSDGEKLAAHPHLRADELAIATR